MFVSPTEPAVFVDTLDWTVDNLPETYGVDFLWMSTLGLVGIQRKEFPSDFLASIHDGRLGSEAFGKMAQLDLCVLLLEGQPRWTSEGNVIHASRREVRWTRTQHRNYLTSVQLRGVQVNWSEDKWDTVQFIMDLYRWTQKDHHNSLITRPTPESNWGHISNRAFQRHFLMSLPRIGPVLADSIIDTLGFPFALTVTAEDLLEVPGVGPTLAANIVKVFREVREGADS